MPVVGDTLDELDETFQVNLTNPSNATIADGQGIGTIVDDDQPPTPDTITLSPESATNPVGTEHCLDALVRQAGAPRPDVAVRYSVTGAHTLTGSAQTDTTGEATFCYPGTAIGTDTITAFADTNANATKDADEPGAEVTKTWVAQPTDGFPCEIDAEGRIRTNGHKASLGIDVRSGPQPTGKVHYEHRGRDGFRLKSTTITEVTLSADRTAATIRGLATIDGAGSVEFRIEAKDVPRAPDSFRIQLSNGYDSGTQAFRKGGIELECNCDVEGQGAITANGGWATFNLALQAIPPSGKLRLNAYGPTRFELKSTAITQVDLSADQTQASVLGTAKLDGSGPTGFRLDVKDLPGAPDTFRITLANGYDSGEQRVRHGDLDIECGNGDHDGRGHGHGHGKGNGDGNKGNGKG